MDIQEWFKQFQEYFEQNPNHGYNCIKVDEFTRQMRVEISKANLSPKALEAVKCSFNYLIR